MKRRIVQALAVLLLLSLAFSSCDRQKDHPDDGFVYPEGYTAVYFHQNYTVGDPNLIHLRAAENSAGRVDENGWYGSYYAIEGVPVEKYVCSRSDYKMLDPTVSVSVVRSPEFKESELEILSWTSDRAELYWRDNGQFSDKKVNMSSVGEDIHKETLSNIDGVGFQTYLKTCLENEDYRVNEIGLIWNFVPKQGNLLLYLRVHFKEYENIVWDGEIVTIDGGEHDYYVRCHVSTTTETAPEGFYQTVFVPLPAEIAELIGEV